MEESVKKEFIRLTKRPGITREELEDFVIGFIPTGFVVGRLAGYIIRWYNGKPIVYKYSEAPNISQTKKSTLNRGSFGAATKFAMALNSIPELRKIWEEAPLEGNCAYRKLIKFQKKRLINNLPGVNNSLTPEYISLIADHKISFDGRSTVNIDSGSDATPDDKLILLLIPYELINKDSAEFEIIKLWNDSSVSEITLNEEQIAVCKKYKKYILYTAVIRSDIEYSNTLSLAGEFEYAAESDNFWIVVNYFSGDDYFDVVRNQRAEVRNRKTEVRSPRTEVGRKAHSPP